MNIADLKAILYQEHEQEKKISILNFTLVAALLVVVACIVFSFFSTQLAAMGASFFNNNGTPLYVKVLLPAMFSGTLIYPLSVLRTSIKTPEKIETVTALVAEGKTAANFATETIYKTTIPLLKINFKLNPFHYLHFTIAGKNFKLPVPLGEIPDVTAFLSGANMERVYSVWNELHADGQESEAGAAVPLKTTEEFKVFASTALTEDVNTMEGGRKKFIKRLAIMVPLIALLMGGFIYYNYQKVNRDAALATTTEEMMESNTTTTRNMLIFFGVLMLASIGYSIYSRKKYSNAVTLSDGSDFTTFKESIFKKMVHFLNPEFEYVRASYIGREEIAGSGIFVSKPYDIKGNDLIVGRHQGVAFQYSDIDISYKGNFSREKDEPDSVFSGQYFIAKFNKRFTTPVYVYAKPTLSGVFANNSIHTYLNKPLSKVTLEDPEFTQRFDVYCEDQIAARYILSTSLMQRIKDLSVQEKKTQLFLAFHNNKVSVLNNTKLDKFETTMFTKIKPELLEAFYCDLYKQLRIIEEMKLDVNIWR